MTGAVLKLDGGKIGVSIAPGKRVGERDIIFIKNGVAKSMRSTTELVNHLSKHGIGLDEIDRVIEWMISQEGS